MDQPSLAERWQARVARWVGRPLFWGVLVLAGLAIPIARTVAIQLPPPLPVLGQLPPFELTDQFGHRYGADELRGKVWIANFIFTRCPTVCPRFTDEMAKLQDRGRGLGDKLHLVSFSVDPDWDTPERLLTYAQKHHASPRAWSFLTGKPEALQETIVKGLKIAIGREGEPGEVGSLFHGTQFVLVDEQLRIRGYYPSGDADALDALVRDAGLLANRGY